MNYDAIIVGAGIGGLMTAAGLLNAGKKVLILEKAAFIGGKYTEVDYEGYKVTTGSWTSMGLESRIGKFCEKVGAHVDYITLVDKKKQGEGLGYAANVRYPDSTEFNPLDFPNIPLTDAEVESIKKILMGLAADKLPAKWDRSKNTPLRQFIDYFGGTEAIYDMFTAMVGVISGMTIDTLPTSEMKVFVDDGIGKFWTTLGFAVGGVKGIIDSLENHIRSKDGEIRTKTKVTKIIVEENQAKGVELSDGEIIESDIVVHNAGPKKLLKLAGRKNFPSDYCKKIDSLIPVEAGALILGLNKPVTTDVPMVFLPGAERVFGLFQPTFFDKNIAPKGKHMIDVFFDIKTHNPRKEIDLALEDLQKFYPDILDASNLDMKVEMMFYNDYPAAETAQTFGQTGDDRLHPVTPIDNLITVGFDEIGSGLAGDIIPINVETALNYILKPEQWLIVG